MQQFYFTKELILDTKHSTRWIPQKRFKTYDPNEQNERYCPRCDNRHKYDCNLAQMIIEFDTQSIQNDTICTITFIDNIKIPLWNRDVELESGHTRPKYGCSNISLTKEEIEKYYNEQVIPIETSSYKYNDNVVVTNFNIKLFADSFADDELESFRCNVDKFIKIFDNIRIEQYLTKIKYILLTDFKKSYVQKQEFLDKYFPDLYKTTIEFTIKNMNKVIMYNNLSSSSTYIPNAIMTKLITLYLDFQINPLFDNTNFGDQKPNPHIGKKKKNT